MNLPQPVAPVEADSAPAAALASAPVCLSLQGVSRGFGSGTSRIEVLHDINLEVHEGEFVAIVGFSGSGKTTLVNLMAGLQKPDKGSILHNERKLRGPDPSRGVIFQSYALMPWMTVRQNVALAVESTRRGLGSKERHELTEHYVRMVNLGAALEKYPSELSGGMRQRVAVARALAMDPEVLLMDEPLSALDALTRGKLQDQILDIWEAQRKTVVLITNDVDEGLLMADRVIPLDPGPKATLGPAFTVDLPRPRDRHTIHEQQRFLDMRREITEYLLDKQCGMQAAAEGNTSLPTVVPITSRQHPRNQRRKLNPVVTERFVEFSQVGKIYPSPNGPVKVVENFELKIQQGEFVSLIGHSGCGKSTVLSMVAGLTEVSEGGVILDGREVVTAGPDRGIVFQAPSLFPWLTAAQNVALGVDKVYPHISRREREDIAAHFLERVGLGNAMHRSTADMSNGMRQRVGIARAFALSPKLLLLDEPFGMLDALTRWELQAVLMDVWQRDQLTAIMVTHDVDEAILLADRVIMMTNGPNATVGKILEIDLPRPRSRAALLAHPDYYRLRGELLDFLSACEHNH